jgi:hypothetical protein
MLMACIYISILTDPLGCIVDRLKVHRPKHRIIEKLMEMGLIQDRKELWKKRAKKSKDNVFPGKLIFTCDEKYWRIHSLETEHNQHNSKPSSFHLISIYNV